MPDIGNIGSTSSYGHFGPPPRAAAQYIQRGGQAAAAETRRTEISDRVEVSDHARYLDALRNMPPERAEKLAQVKAAIAPGTYDTDAKLSIAIDRMLNDGDLDEIA